MTWAWRGRRARRDMERADTEARLRDLFASFEDSPEDGRRLVHDKTIAEILAQDTEAADQLRRDLEADMEQYLSEEFDLIRARFRRDLRFRFQIRSAIRQATQT